MELPLASFQQAYDSYQRVNAGIRRKELEVINLGFNGGKEATKLMKSLHKIEENGVASETDDQEEFKQLVGKGF